MQAKANDEPTTSKAAQISCSVRRPKSPNLTKITTSPSPLNTLLSKSSSSPTSPSAATPTLGQIGKQGSLNFRNSYLSDSDADDQTFLLRTPSIRSHKFIIIPATGSTEPNKKFPTALSTTSLTSLQKLPLRSPTNQNLSELIAPPTTPTTSATSNKFRTHQQPTTTSLLSRSDVIHHQSNVSQSKSVKPKTTALASSNVNTSVKFTIEDYESDNATDATTTTTMTTPPATAQQTATSIPTTMTKSSSSTLDALYSFNMPAITSIYSANNSSNCTLPSQSTSRQLLLSSPSSTSVSPPLLALTKSPPMPSVRPVSALLASSSFNHNNLSSGNASANGTPSMGIGLRPRNDRNSSMRSVVSGEFVLINKILSFFFFFHRFSFRIFYLFFFLCLKTLFI